MARIRTVKPEFFTSEQIVACSISTRLFFIGMWNFCDDGGIHPASVKALKMRIFPGDSIGEAEVQGMIDELKGQGLLMEYQAQGKLYWQVTGWHHQRIDKPNRRYPSPDTSKNVPSAQQEISTTTSRMLAEDSAPEGKGMEQRVEEGNCIEVGQEKEYPASFTSFWEAFPRDRRGSKENAYKAWKAATLRAPENEILSGLAAYEKSSEVASGWAKGAAAWLNDDRWASNYSATPIIAPAAPVHNPNRVVV